MDVTPETISSYVDGELSAEEIRAVEKALESDPALRGTLEEMRLLNGLWGGSVSERDTEEVSPDLLERLYDLKPVPQLESFDPVVVPAVRPRRAWRVLAAAAAILIGFGLLMQTGPEVELTSFSRIAADGSTETIPQVVMSAGDTIRTGDGERVKFRLPDGTEVILLPGTSVELGDPQESVLGDVESGALLLTVYPRPGRRPLGAGGYALYARSATFGVRVLNGGAKLAGFGAVDHVAREVTVAVGRGSLEIDHGGTKQRLSAGQRLVLRKGKEPELGRAWQDELFVPLLREFHTYGREVMPGYYDGQPDVVSLSRSRWVGDSRQRELTLSDAPGRYLALHVRVRDGKPAPLRLTRVVPYGPSRKGMAESSTIETGPVGPEWTVVAVPFAAFDGSGADVKEREIPPSRSRYARIELTAAEPGVEFEIKASLWAARPPLPEPED